MYFRDYILHYKNQVTSNVIEMRSMIYYCPAQLLLAVSVLEIVLGFKPFLKGSDDGIL